MIAFAKGFPTVFANQRGARLGIASRPSGWPGGGCSSSASGRSAPRSDGWRAASGCSSRASAARRGAATRSYERDPRRARISLRRPGRCGLRGRRAAAHGGDAACVRRGGLPRDGAAARFVNVGRGATVDEAALVRALQAGEIAGAALDVFEQEPLPASSPLWEMEQVIVFPHVSGDTLGWGEDVVALVRREPRPVPRRRAARQRRRQARRPSDDVTASGPEGGGCRCRAGVH